MTTSTSGPTRADPAARLLVRAGLAGVRASLAPARVIIGAVCDAEPLLGGERAVITKHPDAVIRGLGAAMVATGAERAVLAIRDDASAALDAARRAARNTSVEIIAAPTYYPMDELLPLDLDLPGARVIGARDLLELSEAMLGKPILDRWVSIAGAVKRPRVELVPIGAPIADLVDPTDPGWVARSGALRGRRLDRNDVIAGDVSDLIVLPAGHHLLQRHRIAWLDELTRAQSACTGCRVCTDGCPHAAAGAPLEPHLALRHLVYRRAPAARASGTLTGASDALACSGCGVCDVLCPAGLHPGALLRTLSRSLGAEGLSPPLLEPVPRPDRALRRLSLALFASRLGLGSFDRPLELAESRFRPQIVRLPLEGGLRPSARKGDRALRGVAIAPGVFASIDGVVTEVEKTYVEIRAA